MALLKRWRDARAARPEGRPVFDRLRRRFAMKIPVTIARTAITEPAAIFAFDLLMTRA